MTKLPKRPFELVKINKNAMSAPKSTCSIVSIKKPQGNLTPSVSIAPVAKKLPPPPTARPPSDSESEPEDTASHFEEKPKGTYIYLFQLEFDFCFDVKCIRDFENLTFFIRIVCVGFRNCTVTLVGKTHLPTR